MLALQFMSWIGERSRERSPPSEVDRMRKELHRKGAAHDERKGVAIH